jgi:hypothetical protein
MSGKIGSGLIFSALMAALITPAFGAEQNHCDYSQRVAVQFSPSGDILWDGVKIANQQELIEKFKSRINGRVQQGVWLKFTPQHQTDKRVFRAADIAGFHCIAYTQIEQYVQ